MNTEIIIALIGVFATGFSSILTYILTKRKYNAEVDKQVIENLLHSLEFYLTLSEDNRKRLEECRKESESLRKQVMDLQTQVLDMSINLCYETTCTVRKLKKELDQTKKKASGTKGVKNTDKKEA